MSRVFAVAGGHGGTSQLAAALNTLAALSPDKPNQPGRLFPILH